MESSTKEKNLGDADRGLMLDQVMKNGVPNSVDDRFFQEDVVHEDGNGDKVTPVKVKREKEDAPETTPEKTLEEKKKDAKIAKLSGGAAALCSFRASLSEKFSESVMARKDKMEIAVEKLKEAQEKLATAFSPDQESQSSGGKGNAGNVFSSYTSLLGTCVEICQAWLDPISPEQLELGPGPDDQNENEKPGEDDEKKAKAKDLDTRQPTPPAVDEKQSKFLNCLQKAEPQVKLSNGELEISAFAMLEFCRHLVITSTCPAWLVAFESEMKGMWAVQDIFQKSLVRIANDVTSYVNQKARSARRTEEKKKRKKKVGLRRL